MEKIKQYLYNLAKKSRVRKWALSLKGWKWWAYQIICGSIFFLILEFLLNLIGLTMLPWK